MTFRGSIPWLAVLAAVLAAAPAARAQEDLGANSNSQSRPAYLAWAAGRAAERAGKLDDAFADYSAAVRDEPSSREYRERLQTVRYALANQLVNQAEREILADRLPQGAAFLRKALYYEPDNAGAAERLRQLERQAVRESTVLPEYASAAPQLAPRTGTRDFNYRGDIRGAWEELAKQFGLAAAFDEDISRREIRFRVPGVDFATAARLLGEQTVTFLRALDAHTFLVISDSQQKRKEYEPQIERTILLPESEKTEQLNELSRAVREIAGLNHAQLNTAARSLTVRGTERDVALATELVRELEQPRGEVMLEIDMLELDRNAAQNLGMVPPSSVQVVTLSKSQVQNAEQTTDGLVQLIQQLFGTPTSFGGASSQQIASLLGSGSASLSSLIPGVIAIESGQTIFLATLPGATVNFAAQLSAVRSARRILVRAQDGEPATFFVGDRYPISFSTLSNAFVQQGPAPAITGGPFPVGASPRGVLTATLRTGSSFLDVVTANHDDGTISVALGNGDGTFQPRVDYKAGTNPVALVSGTFGGASQFLDLAVVDQGANDVEIFAGNGDGTFAAPVIYPVGNFPSGIVTGDFNGDGHADLAVTNSNDNSISILFGNGDGTFQAAQTVQLLNGRGPIGITSADFDGDTHADLAVANSASNTATVMLTVPVSNIARSGGAVTAVLASPLTIPGGNGTGRVSVAGVADNSFNGSFEVLSGSGTDTLTWSQAGPDATSSGGIALTQSDLATGAQPVAIVAAGFNSTLTCTQSGHPDIAVTNQIDGTVSLYLNQCGATFPTRTDFAIGNQPDALIAGDFNNDGAVDLVVANNVDNNIVVLFGSGSGTFPASIPLLAGPGPSALALGDFNSDGLTDVAVALEANNSVNIILNSQQLAVPMNQLPYPSVEFEDIGVKAKATPRLHPNGDVTVNLTLEIRSLSAVSLNGIPVISNRTVEQTFRLKENEPGLISGLLSDQEILSFTGWPGTEQVPGLDLVTGNLTPQKQETELMILVTPRAVRLAPRVFRELYAGYGRESSGAGGGGGGSTGEFGPTIQERRGIGQPFTPGQEQPLIEPPAPGQTPLPAQPQFPFVPPQTEPPQPVQPQPPPQPPPQQPPSGSNN